jgi:hypothetical protein
MTTARVCLSVVLHLVAGAVVENAFADSVHALFPGC